MRFMIQTAPLTMLCVFTVHLASAAVTAPDMVLVPTGSFDMGDPWSEGEADELPVHTVSLNAYEIGSHKVTNAQCAEFLNSALASGEITVISGEVYLTDNGIDLLCRIHPTDVDSQIEYSGGSFSVRSRDGHPMNDHPVLQIAWFGAAAYCNWLSRQQGYQEVYTESGDWPSDLGRDGYHLPTEAQWERAAAWEPGHGHWRHGFRSDSIDSTRANYNSLNPLSLTSTPYTSPVGYFNGSGGTVDSPSDAGCYDMSGNALELCNDWYSSTYYSTSPGVDPEGPSTGSVRVYRGSAWDSLADGCRSARRNWIPPGNDGSGDMSFRVARGPAGVIPVELSILSSD